MTRLKNLYRAEETLRREGLPIDEKLEQSINEAEEKIIKEEILPTLIATIEPSLKQVQRELVLVVDYRPNQPISVHLSRKQNVTATIPDAKQILLDPEVEHTSRENTQKRQQINPTSTLIVHFSDNSFVTDRMAKDAFHKAIVKIGVEKVRKAVEEKKIVINHVPLISNRRDKKYGKTQIDLGEGWLLMTNASTGRMKGLLEQLSDHLSLGLNVEIVAKSKWEETIKHLKATKTLATNESANNDEASKQPHKKTRLPFKFHMVGLKPGDTIIFDPLGIPVEIISDNQIIYKGRRYKLSPFTTKFMPKEKRIPSGAYHGSAYFSHQGKTLWKIRLEKEREAKDH